jgi:prefoldin subunit 5
MVDLRLLDKIPDKSARDALRDVLVQTINEVNDAIASSASVLRRQIQELEDRISELEDRHQ